ncbi:MAG: M14 family metallopeptidase [Candidatus Aminicenantes bacterium]|nr:M14 family metallopeptidase [Candidatus Aminicenantes bacterium]
MKRKNTTSAITAVFAALAFFGLGATGTAQDFTKYHNYAELSAMLQNLAGANKTLVKLESIGKTLEKRDIWAVQIANPGGVPLAERPGLLIAANFEADHLIGSELAMFIADYLVKNYASNANVKQRLDNSVIYILPRINPDGAEFMWAPLKWARRTNTRPFDDDNDGRIDEDGPVDLNKDGLITVMRVKDPNGDYIIDPDEPRLMRKADPKKGERGEYAIYREGIDQDKDGFIGEDGPGGVNVNRNFMHEYPYTKTEAGRYMVSESETRAVLEWMLAHRNVAAILTFGESDNLIVPPNTSGRLSSSKQIDLVEFANATVAGANRVGIFASAGGFGGRGGGRGGGGGEMIISEEMLSQLMAAGGGQFIMGGAGGGGRGGQQTAAQQPASARAQQPARAAATTVNAADIDYFRLIGAKYVELTGIRQQPLVVNPEGAFFQYGYYQFGVPSFSTPGWGLPEAQRGQSMGMPGMGQGGQLPAGGQAQAAAMMGQRGAGGGQRGAGTTGMTGTAAAGGGEQAQSYDRQLLQWMDKEKIDGFAAWTKTKHPDLGEVEIGGFKPYVSVDPPAAKIAELGKSHAEFALYLSSIFPKVGIAKLEATNHGGGIFRIKAEVENSGFLPTALGQGVTTRAVKATMVQLQVAPESIISGNAKTNSVQTLAGSGDRVKFEWLIKAKAGDAIELKVVSQKAGADKRSVVLK